jgi:hypothetical protein
MTAAPQETYLGDGLYASFDGFTIWLRAPREGGDHIVALESLVYAELVRFVADLRAAPRAIPPAAERAS